MLSVWGIYTFNMNIMYMQTDERKDEESTDSNNE